MFDNGARGFIELEQKSTGFPPVGTELRNPNFAAMAEAAGVRGGIRRQGDVAGCRKKKALKPARARQLVEYLRTSYRISTRRACGALRFDRSTYHYWHRRPEQASLRKRIRDLSEARVRYGYRRIHVLLRREGWTINHKRTWRLYREEGH